MDGSLTTEAQIITYSASLCSPLVDQNAGCLTNGMPWLCFVGWMA